MNKTILLVIAMYLSIVPLFSQDNVVNDAAEAEAEFHVAINPLNSNNIVLACQNSFGSSNGGDITIYYTMDFGVTWNISNHHGSYSNGQAGDAVLSFDANGDVLLVNLVVAAGINTILSKSTDGGATWTLVSTVVSGSSDKPWLAVDRYSSSTNNGNVYIPLVENAVSLYTLNNTYQTTNTAAIQDGNHLPSVVVKKDGTVFTSTVELGTDNTVYVQEFSNGGTNMIHSTEVVSFPDYTFNAPDISSRFQPTVYTAIDNSGGPYDGRLYLSYTASETNNPDYFNVFLIYSDDNGLTWSTPSIVHNDQQDDIQQFYSSIYVNDNGILLLDWYDRRNYNNTTKLTDFMIGISADGGDSFTELQLNSVSSDFDFVIPASNNFGIGEYHQMVATNNTAISFWCDGRTNDGDLNIYMSKVNLNGVVSVIEQTVISENISISNLYPQPAGKIANFDLILNESATIKYEIFDNTGKRIKDSDWINYNAGAAQLTIDLDMPVGIYFVQLKSKQGYFKNTKLIKL